MMSSRSIGMVASFALSFALWGCGSTLEGEYRVSSISRRDATNPSVAGACVGFAPPALARVTLVRIPQRSASTGSSADLVVNGAVACRVHFGAQDFSLFQITRLDGCEAFVPAGTRFVAGLMSGEPLSTISLTWARSSDASNDSACKAEDVLSVGR